MKKDMLNRYHFHKSFKSKNKKLQCWVNFRPQRPDFGIKIAIDFKSYIEIDLGFYCNITFSIIWNSKW
ncbi:MAG: hypothetical protein BWY38_03145 [Ignavibacteria bacterium ADurb.Bin266]|nr:MAG: hypothetical protein BWY38_03145 [Ignavibacteria bacterium ADurb.Bin266]